MKKSIYQLSEQIGDGIFLHLCTSTNNFMLLSSYNHILYEQSSVEDLKKMSPDLYRSLVDNGFIVDSDKDEKGNISHIRDRMKWDTEEYHVVVNTTLDCNLNCWYCYEKRVAGSRLSMDVITLIEKNITSRYSTHRFSSLRLSFFGGEPFIDFNGLREIMEWADEFCTHRGIRLIVDFTTNATLIDEDMVEFLRSFTCSFQITLDGDREKHNKIKSFHTKNGDTYQKTLDTLRMINDRIPNRHISVRINFDNRTLHRIDSIIEDISFLDRRKSMVILKRVWQIRQETVDHDVLLDDIQKILDAHFLLDYYVMPKGCICFADRESQVLFNYDGKIFKCTTISNFDDHNSLGHADRDTGEVIWDSEKIGDWLGDLQSDRCKDCEWFPICLGICNRQLLAHPDEQLCNVEGLNLSRKEYLTYLFKFNMLRRELLGQQYMNED